MASAVFGAVLLLALHSFLRWSYSRQPLWAWQSAGFALLAVSAVLQAVGSAYPGSASQGSTWHTRAPDVLDGLCVIVLMGYLHQLVRHFQLNMRGLSLFVLLATVQGLLSVAVTFSNDPLFSTLSSFTVPAVAISIMVLALLQIRQVHYPYRVPAGIILLIILANSIRDFILSLSSFDRASVSAFISIEFSIAIIGLSGLVRWAHATKTVERKDKNNLDPEKISIKYPSGINKEFPDSVLKMHFVLDKAEKKNLHQTRLMSYVSHDLRAPLATIAGCIKSLRSIGTPEQQKHILAIERNIAYQRELVDELLDYGRAELGLLALRPVALDLLLLLEDLSQHATLLAAARGNRTVVEIDKVLPQWVLMDGNRLTQVLLNLLSNAANATHQGVITLHVGGRHTGTLWRLQFEVSDTGPGIALENQARLFDGFQSRESVTAGLGLGLHIARHIVESMGGRLALSSQLGQGSSFTFVVEVPEPVAPPGRHRNVSLPAVVPGRVPTTSPVTKSGQWPEILTLPSVASMNQLAVFAGNGQWTAIEEWLVAAEATQPLCHAFIAQIRLLFSELDFSGIQQSATVPPKSSL